MALILGEFLVMAGSFFVLFAILYCGITNNNDRAGLGRSRGYRNDKKYKQQQKLKHIKHIKHASKYI
jgi:hypothetical protein